jgi:hypothetical protein
MEVWKSAIVPMFWYRILKKNLVVFFVNNILKEMSDNRSLKTFISNAF